MINILDTNFWENVERRVENMGLECLGLWSFRNLGRNDRRLHSSHLLPSHRRDTLPAQQQQEFSKTEANATIFTPERKYGSIFRIYKL